MSLIYVDLRSRRPIFEQIVDSVRDLALRGLMQPDEHLPSVRALAAELAINPNTIQKEYGVPRAAVSETVEKAMKHYGGDADDSN